MIRLYDYLPSGNGYKVRLLLTQLAIPFIRVELNILNGETRTPEFLAKFPNGRIPAVEFEDGRRLFESNAILWYFAEGTRFLPSDSFARARALQWLFFEQYNHEPNIASRRFLVTHPQVQDPRRSLMDMMLKRGYDALAVMESHLAGTGHGDHPRQWFADNRYSIVDIALYAYTHVAPEGGYNLVEYPAVRAWLTRVSAEPGHIPITRA